MRIENEITIDAPLDEVWALTVDIAEWPSITPTVTGVRRLDDAPLDIGSQAAVKQPGMGERTWTVSTLKPPRHFAWQTRFLGSRMVGSHELEPAGNGTLNRLSIDVTGWTSGLIKLLAGRQIAKAIATENAGFKQRAERRP